jgi:hypothetical protein
MTNIINGPIENIEVKRPVRTLYFYMFEFVLLIHFGLFFDKNKNSVALVRERTIPTERPPPVGEVSANFCG